MAQVAVWPAVAVITATSNSNNMTSQNSRNAVGTPTIAGILTKVMKPATACREDNNNIDSINMRWQQQ